MTLFIAISATLVSNQFNLHVWNTPICIYVMAKFVDIVVKQNEFTSRDIFVGISHLLRIFRNRPQAHSNVATIWLKYNAYYLKWLINQQLITIRFTQKMFIIYVCRVRIEFCQQVVNKCYLHANFLENILLTDETCLSHNGVYSIFIVFMNGQM